MWIDSEGTHDLIFICADLKLLIETQCLPFNVIVTAKNMDHVWRSNFNP